MNSSYSTGGCIKSWCPMCNVNSDHTIIDVVDSVPKKVKCNACDEHHNMGSKHSGKSRTKQNSSARKSIAKEATYQAYLSRLAEGDFANSTKYTIKGNFAKDQIIDHLSFGIGIVLSIINFHKIKTLFKDGARLLIQNQ